LGVLFNPFIKGSLFEEYPPPYLNTREVKPIQSSPADMKILCRLVTGE
jgi:hypothetical protein